MQEAKAQWKEKWVLHVCNWRCAAVKQPIFFFGIYFEFRNVCALGSRIKIKWFSFHCNLFNEKWNIVVEINDKSLDMYMNSFFMDWVKVWVYVRWIRQTNSFFTLNYLVDLLNFCVSNVVGYSQPINFAILNFMLLVLGGRRDEWVSEDYVDFWVEFCWFLSWILNMVGKFRKLF